MLGTSPKECKMRLNEILGNLLALAEAEESLELNDSLAKQWIKSIEKIDKSISTGYSLVGNFVAEDEELEPGLYLVYQELIRSYATEKVFPKWEEKNGNRKIARDENSNIVFEKCTVKEIRTIRRGILFDFSAQASLVYCSFLPERWAKSLWKPIENWLEQQPNIEEKIEFWRQEVAIQEAALHKAKSRLAALQHQHSGANEALGPEISEWLQTAAVLGGKKKRPR
jgi:hypothetical protein